MADNARNRISITGGSFHQSAVGTGSIRQNNYGSSDGSSVEDLRSLVVALRGEIPALASDEGDRAAIAQRIDQVENELSEPEPDPDIVRGGWKGVLKVLDAGARASESISKITDLVTGLFGG